MKDRQEHLQELAKERAAIAGPVATERVSPDLKAEGYDTKKAYIEKSTGEAFFLRMAAPEEMGLSRRVYCLKNEFHYHQCDEDDFKKLFEKA
jgi:hypothetical protein